MTSRPWMPFYVADYLNDTRHLTTEQHGAYVLLILHYWLHGGLPDDEEGRRIIVGMSGWRHRKRWIGVCQAIAPFFDEHWRHKRIDAELQKCRNLSDKRAMSGRAGGLKSRGFTNLGRFANGAIAKQTGDTLHKERESESVTRAREARNAPPAEPPPAAVRGELGASSALAHAIRERGWAK